MMLPMRPHSSRWPGVGRCAGVGSCDCFATPSPRLIPEGKKPDTFTGLALAPDEGHTLKGWQVVLQDNLLLHIECKSQEHIDPLNLAGRQLDSLVKWFKEGNQHLLNQESIQHIVRNYHPDKKYDASTRLLRHDSSLHMSDVWLKYEVCDFESSSFDFWSRVAITNGHYSWPDWSAVDHRESAVVITAQLALFEGEGLRHAYMCEPDNTAEIWRRLYWFTRFFRAWQRMFSGFTPTQFNALRKKAKSARKWKADAWAYFLEKSTPQKKVSVRTIAANFSKLSAAKVSQHEVQVFLGRKIKLMTGKPLSKKLFADL